jgi:hypothetical protein
MHRLAASLAKTVALRLANPRPIDRDRVPFSMKVEQNDMSAIRGVWGTVLPRVRPVAGKHGTTGSESSGDGVGVGVDTSDATGSRQQSMHVQSSVDAGSSVDTSTDDGTHDGSLRNAAVEVDSVDNTADSVIVRAVSDDSGVSDIDDVISSDDIPSTLHRFSHAGRALMLSMLSSDSKSSFNRNRFSTTPRKPVPSYTAPSWREVATTSRLNVPLRSFIDMIHPISWPLSSYLRPKKGGANRHSDRRTSFSLSPESGPPPFVSAINLSGSSLPGLAGVTVGLTPSPHVQVLMDRISVFDMQQRMYNIFEETAMRRYRGFGSSLLNGLGANMARHSRIAGDKWWQLGLLDTNCDEYIDALELVTALSTLPGDVIHRYTGSRDPAEVWMKLASEFSGAVHGQNEVMDRLLLVTARIGDYNCSTSVHREICTKVQLSQRYAENYVLKRSDLRRTAPSSWSDDAIPIPIAAKDVPAHITAWLPIPISALVFSPPVSRMLTALMMLTPHPDRKAPKLHDGIAANTPPKALTYQSPFRNSYVGYSSVTPDNIRRFRELMSNDPHLMCLNDDVIHGWQQIHFDFFHSFFRRKLGDITGPVPIELYPAHPLNDIPSFEKMKKMLVETKGKNYDRLSVLPDAADLAKDPPEPMDKTHGAEIYIHMSDSWLVKMRMLSLGGIC